MLDMATMGAALGSLKTIVDLTKNANDAQLALKISSEVAQIQGRLLDVQQQALALQAENQELKATLHALTDIRDNYELRERVNFRKGTQDAYCPLCLGANNKAGRRLLVLRNPQSQLLSRGRRPRICDCA